MDFLELSNIRQSCRSFSSKPVPKEVVEKCLEAARLAPSACNSQPWKFIVVSSQEMHDKVADAAFSGKYSMNAFAKKAPVIVIVARDKDKIVPVVGGMVMRTNFSLVDIGIAAEHLVLAAAEQGIGTCYLGIFDEKKIKKTLKLPNKLKIDLVIPMGYPETDTVRIKSRKPLNEIASFI